MAMIAESEAQLLRAHFERVLSGPVRIDLFVEPETGHFRVVDECGSCGEVRELMEELAALSDKLELRLHVLSQESGEARRLGVERVPAIVLSGASRGAARFTGMPLGSELTGLLEALVDVSRGDSGLDDEARRALSELKGELRLVLFVSASCPYCPQVARLVHRLAVQSEKLTAEVIDLDEFPGLAEHHGVLGVPTLLVNGELALAGAHPESRLLGVLARAAAIG